MKKIIGVGVGLFAVVALACSGGGEGQTPGDKFERDCKVRGGHVQDLGSLGKQCLPPIDGPGGPAWH